MEVYRSADVATEDGAAFDQLLLPDELLRALKEAGFTKPSPVQYQAIPAGRRGHGLLEHSRACC
jgi:ATP-dependent RNA helicase DDX20